VKKESKTPAGMNKGARVYLANATKAVVHPIRRAVLKSLKTSPKSTAELQEETGQDRYNLYHHLKVLVDSDLVELKDLDDKGKCYSLKTPSKPQAAFIILGKEEIKTKQKAWAKVLSGLEEIEGEEIPNKESIKRVEIHMSYVE
jgi:DNA-binding transcriptional ArsR family regulator